MGPAEALCGRISFPLGTPEAVLNSFQSPPAKQRESLLTVKERQPVFENLPHLMRTGGQQSMEPILHPLSLNDMGTGWHSAKKAKWQQLLTVS